MKAARGKKQITHKEILIRLLADFSAETLQVRRAITKKSINKEFPLWHRGDESN